MHHIPVELGDRSYNIVVQPGLLHSIHEFLNEWNHGQTWLMITQPSLYKHFGKELESSLTHHGFRVKTILIPAGETAKSIQQVEELYSKMLQLQCDRSTTLLALGGGVVGDITGFIAATFMRGIQYVQIPTTLLAMVDSSIGGKTGVNLPEGKNLVGAIHQPNMVAIDPTVLKTLPKRELISGLAEVLKYGVINDSDFFQTVGNGIATILDYGDSSLIEEIIARSCEIKSRIVAEDEHESGIRRVLNFGHTIGHALETSLGYDTIRHGEAIAYGMISAGYISHARGLLSDDEWLTLQNVIKQLPLPDFEIPKPETLLNVIRRDKKVRAGILHYVLINGIGNAIIADDVTTKELSRSFEILQ